MASSTATIPSVRMAKPKGRPIQLRYTDRETGKEIRITTGVHDESEAESQKAALEAKLLLGMDAKPRKRVKAGPSMDWQDFRERYGDLQLSTLKSEADAESRLDVIERILKPRTLADVANSEALHDLQQRLLAGEGSLTPKGRKPQIKPRSPHTVRTTMAVLLAALRWAEFMEWLPAVPRVKRLKTSKLRHMKGRPLCVEEFEKMLMATEAIVGKPAAESWKRVITALWESGLRLTELMHVHWTDERYIVPKWVRGSLPVLQIPATMQKNATEEAIPLLPGFEALLLQTPEAERNGWAFNPVSLQLRLGRKPRHGRPTPEWVGKVIGDIGEKAGIVVQPAVGEKAAKYASAHDLRRSCADRLVAAGVSERDVAAVMRHASVETTRRHYAPGNVQRTAGAIRAYLGTVSGGIDVSQYTPQESNL